jgi:DNA-binding transcriptional LysR family regulator
MAGLGISWFSLVTVARELASGTLVRIPVKGMSLRRTFFLVRHRAKHESPAIRAFSEFVQAWRPAAGG